MRSVEVRGASPAFIDALSWSVNCSRRLMAPSCEKNTLYYMRSDSAVMWVEEISHPSARLLPREIFFP